MPIPTATFGSVYHPHLHCTLWKAYKIDPTVLLDQHGYKRVAP